MRDTTILFSRWWKRLRCRHRWIRADDFEWGPWENEHDWSRAALTRCSICGAEAFVHPSGHEIESVVARDSWAME